jgi:hypothetical protein
MQEKEGNGISKEEESHVATSRRNKGKGEKKLLSHLYFIFYKNNF